MDAKDIIKIIKTCKEMNVSYIKINDVEVSFNENSNEIVESGIEPIYISDQKSEEISKEAMVEKEAQLEEDRLAELDIENFEEYESLQVNGEVI